jgi:hypothetical protein
VATIIASVFARFLIFVVPFGYSAFPSEPKVGFEHEFAEIKIADSENVFNSENSLWFRLAENQTAETPIDG